MEKFVSRIHEEILQTLDRRHKLDLAKITFTTSLLGLGSFSIRQNPPLLSALFLAPLVALSFDLLIMRELHSLRRIGNFITQNSPRIITKDLPKHTDSIELIEYSFEKGIKQERNPYYRTGLTLLTTIIWLASLLLFLYSERTTEIGKFIFWGIYLVIAIIHLFFIYSTVFIYDYDRGSRNYIRRLLSDLETICLIVVFAISIFLHFLFPTADILISHYQNKVDTLLGNIKPENKKYEYNPVKLALVVVKTKEVLTKISYKEKGRKDDIIRFLLDAKLLDKLDLNGVDLSGADLRDFNLKNAILRSADLREVDLRIANLRGADLRGANLTKANLAGADLTNIIEDENTTWTDVRGLDKAIVPSHLKQKLNLN